MNKYKLDRNAFSMGSQETKESAIKYWRKKTPAERLQVAFYLNSVAYNFNLTKPPVMDRTVFTMRKNKP